MNEKPKTTITIEKNTLRTLNVIKAKYEKRDNKTYNWDTFFKELIKLVKE